MFPLPSVCTCPSPLRGRNRARGARTEQGAGGGCCLAHGVCGCVARSCGRAGQSQDEPLLLHSQAWLETWEVLEQLGRSA